MPLLPYLLTRYSVLGTRMYMSTLLTCQRWHWHLCVRVNHSVFFFFSLLSRVRFSSSRHLGTRVVDLLSKSAYRLSFYPSFVYFFTIPFLGRQSHLAVAIQAAPDNKPYGISLQVSVISTYCQFCYRKVD